MNSCYLAMGDWSMDGHYIREHFYYNTNYPVRDMQEAYKRSCKRFGIAFHYGLGEADYTGKELTCTSGRLIWVEDESNYIREEAYIVLKENGCLEGIDLRVMESFGDKYYFVDDISKCADIIMRFIGLSMPEDFTFVKTQRIETAEPINGYWNKNLNVQFGYGLYV